MGPGSVVGIATAYGLDGPGIESRWGEIFRTCPDRPWSPPSLLYKGYRVFPGGKVRPERDADPSPLLVPRSKIEYSYTSTLPKGLRGLWKGETYLLSRWPACCSRVRASNSNYLCLLIFCKYTYIHMYVFLAKYIVWNHPPRLTLRLLEKSVSTCVACTNVSGLGTTYKVTSDYDSTKDYQDSQYQY